MNRRDLLFQAASAATAATGIAIDAVAHDELPEAETICFVFRMQQFITKAAAENIMRMAKRCFAGTKWADVPVMVLPGGLEFLAIREPSLNDAHRP